MDSSDVERIQSNRELWNERVAFHRDSDFYDVEAFRKGRESLNPIEIGLLGDLEGASVLHLQCHFGLDTLSLARRGAVVTGVDFSESAVDLARTLASDLAIPAEFVCSNVYDLDAPGGELAGRTFDRVFASYGVIGWLPDLVSWARLVAKFLKPGGKFVFVEFHPVVWMYDDDFEKVVYPYFDRGVIETISDGSYAAPDAPLRSREYGWNHPLAEVFSALLGAGLRISSFEEYDYSPYTCFRGMREIAPGRHRIAKLDGLIPLVYSLVATRESESRA